MGRVCSPRLPIELLVHVIQDEAGQPECFFSFVTDLTERKAAENALRQSEDRLRFALETCHIGAWDLDLVDHTAYRSADHDRIFGYPELLPEWSYEMFLNHVLPDDRTAVDAKFQAAIATQGNWNFECRIRRADDEVRWIWVTGRHRTDAAGGMRCMAGVVQDITSRKQAEEVLKQNEQRFRTMADAMPQLAWIAQADGGIHWYNRRWYDYTGTTPDQMDGWGWQSVHEPAALPRVLERWQACIATGEAFDMTFPLRGADGMFRPFLTRGVPMKDEQGNVLQWFGTNTDVTEQKRAEEALKKAHDELETRVQERTAELRDSQQRFTSMLEGVRDYAIIFLNPDGCVNTWNKGAEHIIGYLADEIVGQSFSRFYLPEDIAADKPGQELRTAMAEGRYEEENWRIHKDGSRFWASVVLTALRDADGKVNGFVKITRDLTARKQADAEIRSYAADLQRSNRELEHFAYVASHDLQEPLRTVGSFSELLAKRYHGKLDGDADEFITFIVDGAKRMQTLINDLLAFSRVGSRGQPFTRVKSEEILQTARKNLDVSIAESAAIITHDLLPELVADRGQLTQLMQNLLGNAIKFKRPGVAPRIHVSATHQDGAWQLSVRDNGIGILPEYFERIFILFQRLHGRDEYPGTGIGLAICMKIAERHGGRMWVESEPESGSIFHFTIPDTNQIS